MQIKVAFSGKKIAIGYIFLKKYITFVLKTLLFIQLPAGRNAFTFNCYMRKIGPNNMIVALVFVAFVTYSPGDFYHISKIHFTGTLHSNTIISPCILIKMVFSDPTYKYATDLMTGNYSFSTLQLPKRL